MTKGISTHYGEELSPDSKYLVDSVRKQLKQAIHPNYDTDFNVYRFVMAAERLHKKKDEIVKVAGDSLSNHLRIRKSLQLDTMADIPFEENPLFKKQFMPQGDIIDSTDIHNRILWYIEYATISVDTIAHGMRSSQSCILQFYQFEHMLKMINKQEAKTGKLSSVRHIIDMDGYEINPFTMLFVSSGTLTYYSQLFHYENYPELVTPVDIVRIAKWIHIPYKLAKAMMPTGFSERFRLLDDKYLQVLEEEINPKDIPVKLGGINETISCKGAKKLHEEEYWKPMMPGIIDTLEHLVVHARKNKVICIEVETPKELAWYFKSEGDVFFGVFYDSQNSIKSDEHLEKFDFEDTEMVYPWLKIAAKLVHEAGTIKLDRPGKYYMVFGNKHSWIAKRTIELGLQLRDATGIKKHSLDGSLQNATGGESIFKCLEAGFE
uniref:CRAL-TRIO domain-containing protein n=1 Tax=Rhabditophanes sp. KR3021 TaxID=114890 RepID=A0AC35UG41_9BILA